ncbi:hypothetical protein AYI70_g6694 [Smittium culicis]|uniref:Uncharacterized protein n=1 Tax=Smittium culicis TaxID=133412 RepID=A0A1R1XNV3_9FUNG|nr:hypothetical protein AYI70_g6694 [Smittium culicis]
MDRVGRVLTVRRLRLAQVRVAAFEVLHRLVIQPRANEHFKHRLGNVCIDLDHPVNDELVDQRAEQVQIVHLARIRVRHVRYSPPSNVSDATVRPPTSSLLIVSSSTNVLIGSPGLKIAPTSAEFVAMFLSIFASADTSLNASEFLIFPNPLAIIEYINDVALTPAPLIFSINLNASFICFISTNDAITTSNAVWSNSSSLIAGT